MSAFDYVESRRDADELIQEFGRAVQIVRKVKSGAEYDPDYTETSFATFGVKIEFSRRQVATGEVKATDERWLIAAGPLATLGVTTVAPPDTLYVAGTTRSIYRCDPLEPAGTVVLFDCWIR